MNKYVNKLCCAEYFIFITLVVYRINCQKIEQLFGSTVAIVFCTECLLSSLVKFSVYKTRRRVKLSHCQACAMSFRHFEACTIFLYDIVLTLIFAS